MLDDDSKVEQVCLYIKIVWIRYSNYYRMKKIFKFVQWLLKYVLKVTLTRFLQPRDLHLRSFESHVTFISDHLKAT